MIIVNDKLCDEDKVNFIEGLSFGRGLFETILVKKEPIFLSQHLERINTGLIKIGISNHITPDYVRENISKLQAVNCAVKMIVTSNNVTFVKREISYIEKQYKDGFSLLVSDNRRNKYSSLTYLKSINYLDNILEREKTLKAGYDEALFLNTDNEICEGSVSNIFYVNKGKVYTPTVECGLLNGIVRKYIINRYNAIEGKYRLEDLYNCDGVFITNSLMGVMKIVKINNYSINQNEIIQKIREDYNKTLINL